MFNKRNSRWFLVTFLLFTSVILCSCSSCTDVGRMTVLTSAEESSVFCTATFLKIGKADAVLLRGVETPFTVLIDTGEADDGAEILSHIQAEKNMNIDRLILTHFDKDHIGSVPYLLSSVPVSEILMPSYTGEGEAYEAMKTALSLYAGTVTVLTADMSFSYGSVVFTVSVPKETVYEKKQDNNSSLVITVSDGISSMLLTGDAEKLRQEELLADGIPDIDLLKVPHHGVWNKGLDVFFSAVSPTYALITCSAKNPPDAKTLSALSDCGTEVFLTSNGDITAVFRSDGLSVIQ